MKKFIGNGQNSPAFDSDGNLSLPGDLGVGGDLSIDGDSSVTGNSFVGGDLAVVGESTFSKVVNALKGFIFSVVGLGETPGIFFRDATNTIIAYLYWIANNVTAGSQDTDVVLNIIKAGVHTSVIDTVVETVTVAGVAKTTGTTHLELVAATGTVTLADGAFDGQKKVFVMTVDNGQVTITVANHEGANAVDFVVTAVNDIVILGWYGTEWYTIKEITT